MDFATACARRATIVPTHARKPAKACRSTRAATPLRVQSPCVKRDWRDTFRRRASPLYARVSRAARTAGQLRNVPSTAGRRQKPAHMTLVYIPTACAPRRAPRRSPGTRRSASVTPRAPQQKTNAAGRSDDMPGALVGWQAGAAGTARRVAQSRASRTQATAASISRTTSAASNRSTRYPARASTASRP